MRRNESKWGEISENNMGTCERHYVLLFQQSMPYIDAHEQERWVETTIIKGETDHGSGRLRSDHLGKFPLGTVVAPLILGGEKATRGWLHCGKGESTSLSVIASLMEDSTHVFR